MAEKAEIAAWLTERIAYFLEKQPSDIDPDVELVELGLDSVYALTLCGDIEEHFGLAVEPTLPWDYPTVHALAGHLAETAAGADAAPRV
ncbi:acyl carrier protein [Micromonospora sp. DR5-3]|uniref:acyl carrier protein n=1 Tax=unclassified Micromonospora TaxID=2617518 RepID=UPI0011DA842E|nr:MULTISPECIES: acyl carrier protein [unclassified Micromonospora]MCW3817573.1 acyl carrier protein [Micromonospora sp. DR5-3]TYC22061.1 acyl carrier protein [Micromonospora sp. MP36]